MEINIRRASRDGLDTIQNLVQQIWRPTYKDILSEEQITYMLTKMYAAETLTAQMEAGHEFLLLLSDEQPVGFAGYEYDCPEKGVCKLHKIYLLPETQGRGYGKLLLNTVRDSATARDQHSLRLNVNRYNKALTFYKHYGFEVIAEEDIDIGSGYFMNDYVMVLALR